MFEQKVFFERRKKITTCSLTDLMSLIMSLIEFKVFTLNMTNV